MSDKDAIAKALQAADSEIREKAAADAARAKEQQQVAAAAAARRSQVVDANGYAVEVFLKRVRGAGLEGPYNLFRENGLRFRRRGWEVGEEEDGYAGIDIVLDDHGDFYRFVRFHRKDGRGGGRGVQVTPMPRADGVRCVRIKVLAQILHDAGLKGLGD